MVPELGEEKSLHDYQEEDKESAKKGK